MSCYGLDTSPPHPLIENSAVRAVGSASLNVHET